MKTIFLSQCNVETDQLITTAMAMANGQAFVLWGLLLTKPKQILHIFIKTQGWKINSNRRERNVAYCLR